MDRINQRDYKESPMETQKVRDRHRIGGWVDFALRSEEQLHVHIVYPQGSFLRKGTYGIIQQFRRFTTTSVSLKSKMIQVPFTRCTQEKW